MNVGWSKKGAHHPTLEYWMVNNPILIPTPNLTRARVDKQHTREPVVVVRNEKAWYKTSLCPQPKPTRMLIHSPPLNLVQCMYFFETRRCQCIHRNHMSVVIDAVPALPAFAGRAVNGVRVPAAA